MSLPDEAGYGYDPEKDSETTEIFVFSPFHMQIEKYSFPIISECTTQSSPRNYHKNVHTKLLILTTSILTT